MALIDRTPLSVLIVAAALFGLAPFFPQPHLWEKLVMLSRGELSRAIDIFDLFVHGGPLVLLGWKLKRQYRPHTPDLPDDAVDI